MNNMIPKSYTYEESRCDSMIESERQSTSNDLRKHFRGGYDECEELD